MAGGGIGLLESTTSLNRYTPLEPRLRGRRLLIQPEETLIDGCGP